MPKSPTKSECSAKTPSPKRQIDKSVKKGGSGWTDDEIQQMLMCLLGRLDAKMTKADAEAIGNLLHRTPKSITLQYDRIRKKNREMAQQANNALKNAVIGYAPLSSESESESEKGETSKAVKEGK